MALTRRSRFFTPPQRAPERYRSERAGRQADRGSTVLFNAADGKDTIYTGRDTTIKLGEGLTADNMQVTYSEGTASISFGDGSDQLTVKVGVGPVTMSFADGTSVQIGADTPRMLPQVAAA
jgi:hypothetical protein